MEQRPLRLGDIVDDYCTRERRVTNHVVVALVENAIRQTRCSTCDTEHPYKGAREPRLRKKPATSALYDQVLANVTGDRPSGDSADVVELSATEDVSLSASTDEEQPGADSANGDSPAAEETEQAQEPPVEGGVWLAHRRLIRATLPRTENEPPVPRPIPEFTMHQRPPSPRGGRGFRFRGGHGGGNGNGQSPNGFGGHGGNRHGGGNGSGRPGRHRGKKHR